MAIITQNFDTSDFVEPIKNQINIDIFVGLKSGISCINNYKISNNQAILYDNWVSEFADPQTLNYIDLRMISTTSFQYEPHGIFGLV